MKALFLYFSILFLFPINSQAKDDAFLLEVKEKALHLRDLLSKGDIEAYRSFSKSIAMRNKKTREAILSFVDPDGNNVLHFLVRLERFENLNQKYNLEELLVEEIRYVLDNLGEKTFARLSGEKNGQEFSPLQEAKFAQAPLESDKDWKLRLSQEPDFNRPAFSQLLEISTPEENRGSAFKALQTVAFSINSNMPPWEKTLYVIGGGFGILGGTILLSIGIGTDSAVEITNGGASLVTGSGLCRLTFINFTRQTNKLKKVKQELEIL